MIAGNIEKTIPGPIGEVHYKKNELPIYTCRECIGEGNVHSQMAHMHKDIELIAVLKGSMDCQTGESTFRLNRGDICFVNRKQMHALYPVSSDVSASDESRHRVLFVGSELLLQMPDIYNKYIRDILEDMRFTHLRFEGKDSHAAEINELMERLEALQEKPETGYELEMMSLLYSILWHLYVAYNRVEEHEVLDGNGLIQKKMAEFIYENYSSPIGLDDIARAGNVSRSQCSKLFKDYTRLSPINFLNKHRLEMSCDMLRSTDKPIASVASDCGFTDQSYYNRLFMRQYAVTPREYRKMQ